MEKIKLAPNAAGDRFSDYWEQVANDAPNIRKTETKKTAKREGMGNV